MELSDAEAAVSIRQVIRQGSSFKGWSIVGNSEHGILNTSSGREAGDLVSDDSLFANSSNSRFASFHLASFS